MKKLILGSAILAVLGMSANAMAVPNTGTVNFVGAVSSATCEIGLQDSAGQNMTNVNLGTIASNATGGTAINFKLVPQDQTCLTKTAASVTWTSPTLSANGLDNAAANGTNAFVNLLTTNATGVVGNQRNIKQGQTAFEYSVTGGIKSFDFQAALAKPAAAALTAGPFSASASYVVAYK